MNGSTLPVFKNFTAKIEIYFEKGPFILKTINQPEELEQAMRLRYEVFHQEMIGKEESGGIDVDEFDIHCDHLVIIDKKSMEVIGTYRLNPSNYNSKFYSRQEFEMDLLLKEPFTKIELGRACIKKEFRKGVVIALLWRGLAEYLVKAEAEMFFGCGSMVVRDPRQVALLTRFFEEEGCIAEEYAISTTPDYTMVGLEDCLANLNRPLTDAEKQEARALIPPLMKAYINAGAKLGGRPAWDEEFQCIDFLTILKRDSMVGNYSKRYQL